MRAVFRAPFVVGILSMGITLAGSAVMPWHATAAEPSNTVVMKNFDFSPMVLTVRAGTTVTWKNMDGEPHTVASIDGAFHSSGLDQGESFSFKFGKPGTYKYLCSIHPQMTAEIVVK